MVQRGQAVRKIGEYCIYQLVETQPNGSVSVVGYLLIGPGAELEFATLEDAIAAAEELIALNEPASSGPGQGM